MSRSDKPWCQCWGSIGSKQTTGDTMNTETGSDNPEDDEPTKMLSEDARYGRGEV